MIPFASALRVCVTSPWEAPSFALSVNKSQRVASQSCNQDKDGTPSARKDDPHTPVFKQGSVDDLCALTAKAVSSCSPSAATELS
jgi:hypothetical protein